MSTSMTFWIMLGVECPSTAFCVSFQVVVKGVETAFIMKAFHQFSVYLRGKHPFIHTISYEIQMWNDDVLASEIAINLLPAKLIRIAT